MINKTEIFWLTLALCLIVLFICLEIASDGIRQTLELLLLIAASRAFISCGFLSKSHIPAVKSLLFNICFPFIIFQSVANAKQAEIGAYAVLSGIAFLQDVLALFAVGAMMYGFVCFKVMTKAEALGVVFSMSAIATMSTGLPFAKMLGGKSPIKLVFMDQGNKMWILIVVYIIIVSYFGDNNGGYLKMAQAIGSKIVKNPLIVGFVLGFVCLAFEYNTKKLKLTGQMVGTFSSLTNTMTMIFIGMKLEIPEDPKPFLPICLRRGFGMLFVAATVTAFSLSQEDFNTLIIYVSAGASLFPYVYFKSVAPNDSRVDAEYVFQTVTYDYFAAIVVNSVISLGTVPTPVRAAIVGCAFLAMAVALGFLSLFLARNETTEESDKEIEIASSKPVNA